MTLPLALLFALAVAVMPPAEEAPAPPSNGASGQALTEASGPTLAHAFEQKVVEVSQLPCERASEQPIAQAQTRGCLEVHFIDVGQGDGMLIRSPAGKTILIDSGNVGAGSAVNDYLARQNVEGLDLVIVSHPHMDHMGGLVEVLEKHPPKAYLDPGYAHPIAQYDALLEWLGAKKVPVIVARAGRTITVEPGITLELFAPESPLLSGTRSDANSNSVVAKLVYGNVSFLFTGDAEDVTEQRVMRYTDKLESTVLKVAHHGGRHSTSDVWLSRVMPTYAVISAGALNRYKHPTKETLGRLEARGIKEFRTDTQGDIVARTDGKAIKWETTGELSAKLDERGGRSSYQSPKPESAVSTASARPSSKVLVDVNTADEAALMKLPGIGKGTAQKIIEDREQRGPYADLAALMRIRGIGQKTVNKLAGYAEARLVKIPAHNAMHETGPAIDTRVKAGKVETPPPAESSPPLYRGAPTAPQAPTSQERHPRFLTGSANKVNGVAELEEDSKDAPKEHGLLLDINQATQEELVELGLAAVEARAVVEYRDSNRGFKSIDELESVELLTPQNRLRVLPFLKLARPREQN